jgi:S1/P1 Nuclease
MPYVETVRRRAIFKILVPLLAALLLLPGRALAWGSEGHHIVADIAEQYLESATAQQVHELLAVENVTTLAAVSTWADDIRTQRPETAPWHYVNIPINPPNGTPPAYDPRRDCEKDDCVVAAIGRFETALRDKAAPPRQRLEALKWLVHLVGDINQPLHCADNQDRGGNDVHVDFMGWRTNLHAVWDSGILAAAHIRDERAYALELAHSISPAEAEKWRSGTPADWADDSYGVARNLIYGVWPHDPGALPDSYEQKGIYVVQVQLEKGGVRLAAVLNEALR